LVGGSDGDGTGRIISHWHKRTSTRPVNANSLVFFFEQKDQVLVLSLKQMLRVRLYGY
jgi:hypothetical protein